mmetsp:Transcript_42535/g.51842  ORF Transcript_42535/g.51842 Transcript_42535/m.51842 type:complete len:129 (-) Transcript_42535:77-463(-)
MRGFVAIFFMKTSNSNVFFSKTEHTIFVFCGNYGLLNSLFGAYFSLDGAPSKSYSKFLDIPSRWTDGISSAVFSLAHMRTTKKMNEHAATTDRTDDFHSVVLRQTSGSRWSHSLTIFDDAVVVVAPRL